MTSSQPQRASAPPSNAFWTKYSPNGEAVFSPLASAVVHGLALGILLLGVTGWLKSTKPSEPFIELVPIGGDGLAPGGGGDLNGSGKIPNQLGRADIAENLTDKTFVRPTVPESETKIKGPPPVNLDEDPEGHSRPRPTASQDGNTRIKLGDALAGISPKGVQGPGAGFLKGPGTGTGPRTIRDERAARWEMIFRADSHADYLRQLHALGAYIGIPDLNGKLMIVKNLNDRPTKWQYETNSELDRVYWIDNRPESARGIAELLQMDVIPSMFVAFIPRSIEDQLVKVEMEYAAKYKVTKESDIKETQFNVSFRAGKPQFTVKSQSRR